MTMKTDSKEQETARFELVLQAEGGASQGKTWKGWKQGRVGGLPLALSAPVLMTEGKMILVTGELTWPKTKGGRFKRGPAKDQPQALSSDNSHLLRPRKGVHVQRSSPSNHDFTLSPCPSASWL